MAGIIGTSSGGYASVGPTRNYIGEAMLNVQDSMFRQKTQSQADEKAKADAERSIQEALEKQTARDQALFEKHPEGKNLGIEQPDVLLHNNVLDSRTQYTAAGEILSNPNATPQQRSQAFGIQQSALRSIDEAKDFKTQLGAVIDAARENKGGVYNPQGAKEALDNSLKFTTGQWRLVKDEKGNTKVDTFDVDEEGKFTKATGVGLSFQELLGKYTPPLAYSNEANNIEFKKALPPISEWESADGKKVMKGYQGIEGYAEDNANGVVTNRDKMYGIASAAGVKPQLDLKDYTDDDIKKVKAFIVNGFKEKYKSAETNNYEKLTLDNKIRQDEINNKISSENLKVSQDNSKANIDAKNAEKNTEKTSKTSVKLTPAGKARLAKYQKENPTIKNIDYNLVGFAPGEYETVTTSSTSVKKSNGDSDSTKPKAPTKAELKAKADALRKKYAPKK